MTPKAAVAALDSQLRPWINPWLWLVAALVTVSYAYYIGLESGQRDGIQDGRHYQFERLCGFSPTRDINLLNQEIPDKNIEVPPDIQTHCLNSLMEEEFTPSE